MKKLYLIRHAQAEDPLFEKRDFDRNLTDSGKDNISRIAREIARDLPVDTSVHAISSSANRAVQTAALFCAQTGYPFSSVNEDIRIYEAHYLDILQVINEVSSDTQTLLIFGHNPGLSMLIDYLSREHVDLKTSQVACMELAEKIDFSQLSAGMATLRKVYE